MVSRVFQQAATRSRMAVRFRVSFSGSHSGSQACIAPPVPLKFTAIMSQTKTNLRPAPSTVLLQAGVPVAVGAWLLYRARPIAAGVLFGIGAMLLISGLFIPALFNRIERFGKAFGHGVSTALTWLIMVPVFFLVFVPGRVILVMRGIDPMCRRFPTDAPTYWVPRKPVSGKSLGDQCWHCGHQ